MFLLGLMWLLARSDADRSAVIGASRHISLATAAGGTTFAFSQTPPIRCSASVKGVRSGADLR